MTFNPVYSVAKIQHHSKNDLRRVLALVPKCYVVSKFSFKFPFSLFSRHQKGFIKYLVLWGESKKAMHGALKGYKRRGNSCDSNVFTMHTFCEYNT